MKATLTDNSHIDKQAWDALVSSSPQGSIFSRSWYIDAMQEDWQGITVYDGPELQAVMPLTPKRKYGFRYTLQPGLAKHWGICFLNRDFSGDSYEEYSWKRKVAESIAKAIPVDLKAFEYNFHPAFDYALPFAWEGYTLKTQYTYVLDLRSGYEAVSGGFSKSLRKKVNKAGRNELFVTQEDGTDRLKELYLANESRGKQILSRKDFAALDALYAACRAHDACYQLSVTDKEGKVIATSIFLYDDKTTYYLSGIVHPDQRQTAAVPLMTAEALRIACEKTTTFDFLGSMNESIETFFRSFGPRPVPYLNISKYRFPFSLRRR